MPAADLPSRVQAFIAEAAWLPAAPRPVVVGVSGGADSLALAHLLARLGYRLVVAHLDHGLHAESAAQATAVQAWAHAQGWPVEVGRAEVRARARRERISLEDAARRERYAFLFRVAEAHGAGAVAVGHTLDDQAETVLLRLLRGAGVEGLRAMQPYTVPTPWHPRIPLVRPLLAVRRHEVQDYARAHGLPVQHDPTNRDLRYTRNRVRHQVLPLLAQINPRIVETLGRTAQALAADAAILAAAEDDAWARTVTRATPEFVHLDAAAWSALPTGLRYRVLRRAARHLQNQPFWWEPAWRHIVEADKVFRQRAAPRPRPWIRDLRLLTRPDGLFVLRGRVHPPGPWPQTPDAQPRLLQPGQQLPLAHGWRLVATEPLPAETARRALAERPPGPWMAWIDAEAAPPPWTVAPPRPGERFAPLGLAGHTTTVGDAFTKRKIPLSERARWPIVRDAHERIAWFPGYGPAHHARLTDRSRTAVRLTLIPPQEQAA